MTDLISKTYRLIKGLFVFLFILAGLVTLTVGVNIAAFFLPIIGLALIITLIFIKPKKKKTS